MGHPSKNVLKHVEENTNGFTNKLKIPSTNSICPGCAQGKMHNKAFPMSEKQASKPLELIHADLVELPIRSYHKYKYACMILEDYSSFASCTLLRSKSETLTAVKNFIELMENQLETKIKQFHSNRGGEFKSKDFDTMLKSKGIIRQTIAPDIHQQNGCAERINNTILEKSEAMRTHSGCPQSWWEFSFETAIHVYNRTPLRRTKWTTPFENLFNKMPDVHYFKAFGCLAWVYIPKELRKNKLDPRSEKMTFVGYDIGSKAYKFMRKDNAVFTAAHALFDENPYPRLKNENGFGKNKLVESPTGITKDQKDIIIPTNPTKPIDHDHNPDHNDSSDDTSDNEKQKSESEEEEDESIKSESEVEKQLETSREHSRECSIHSSNEKSDDGSHSGYETDHGLEDEPEIPDEPEEPPQQLQRSSRVPKPVIRSDNVYGKKPAIEIEKEICTKTGWQKAIEPKTSLITKNFNTLIKEDIESLLKQGGNHMIQFLLAQAEKNPKEMQYRDILVIKGRDPKAFIEWQEAMKAEIQALNDRDVWELIELPPNRKPIRCRWVYDVKTDGRKRGRLVAKGFSQIPGIDFEETFSPVARFETVRLLLALSALEDWEIQALDVKTAFLYGELDEELYMEQPEGFIIKGQETKVYRLKKALYGLKQASLAWNKQADKSLKAIGFERCLSDTGVYIQIKNDNTLVVVLYVDDVLFLGNNKTLLMEKKNAFMKKWECRDLGNISEYLKMQIVRDRKKKKLVVDQISYARKVVEQFG